MRVIFYNKKRYPKHKGEGRGSCSGGGILQSINFRDFSQPFA
jgi:hypothetical protein